MFFSEEKNQKTFVLRLFHVPGHWPACLRWLEFKSLLVLFFRKEHSYFSMPYLCPTQKTKWSFKILWTLGCGPARLAPAQQAG
jgi:hypothetical protein